MSSSLRHFFLCYLFYNRLGQLDQLSEREWVDWLREEDRRLERERENPKEDEW